MYKHFFKRLFDLIIALFALPFVLLLILIMVPLIWLTDRGPTFYNAQRVGLNGKIFKLKDMLPGINAPNMHPFCRCSTAPHVNDKAFWDDLLDRKVISQDEYKQAFDDRTEANKAIELRNKRKNN